jgi:hypothetical protein
LKHPRADFAGQERLELLLSLLAADE